MSRRSLQNSRVFWDLAWSGSELLSGNNRRNGENLFHEFFGCSAVTARRLLASENHSEERQQHSHGGFNDPIQVLLVWLITRTSVTNSCLPEEFGLPVFFTTNRCSLLALSIFYERLFVGSSPLVGLFDGIGDLVPEILGLAIRLFAQGAGLDG